MSVLFLRTQLKPVVAALLAVAVNTSLVQAAEPVSTTTLQELMAVVITDTTNVLWNAALLEPPAGADKPAPTDAEWQEFRDNALKLQTIPALLLADDLQIAPAGTPATEGSLAPDAVAALRKDQWEAWQAQVKILQESAAASLRAIEAKDFDGMLQAGDTMYAVCDSCHQQFWYPGQP
jgi:hypothetical protein